MNQNSFRDYYFWVSMILSATAFFFGLKMGTYNLQLFIISLILIMILDQSFEMNSRGGKGKNARKR